MFTAAQHSKFPVSNQVKTYHRPRIEKYFIQVPISLLYDYMELSDGAKLTYQTLLSFDYLDPMQGEHKGIVFPSIETLMSLRSKGRSTIYSHLSELEAHGLIEMLVGEGIRLYNPQERQTKDEQGHSPKVAETAARKSHRAPQRPSHDALTYDDGVDKEADQITLTFQKSGRVLMEEKEEIKTIQYQYSEEGEKRIVVEKLVKLGFDAMLGRQFVRRYGAGQVDEQITNLCRSLQAGLTIRSFARWLYCAIERNYSWLANPISGQTAAKLPKRNLGQEVRLPSGEVVFEVIEYSRAD